MKLVKLGVFALALGMFASCGNKAEGEKAPEAAATTAAPTTPAEAPKPADTTKKVDTPTAAPAPKEGEAKK